MWDEIIAILNHGRRCVLTTHVSSDGDGIGCELALARTLRRLGKDVAIINPTPTQPRYEFLFDAGEVEHFEDRHRPVVRSADVIIVLDINRWDRLGGLAPIVRDAPGRKICIDHHPDPEHFGDADVSEATASATGILIHDLILALTGELQPDVIDPLYVAIMTDTGSFRFANTNHRALEVAADLVARGARPDVLYRNIYETSSPGRMRLLGLILSGLEYAADGRLVHFTVTNRMLEDCGVARDDAEGFTDIVRGVDGAAVVLSFVELDDGSAKVSLRAKGGALDVGRLARDWGGGGHASASGIVDGRPLATVRHGLVERVVELLAGRP